MYSTEKELKAITQDGCLGLALAQERAVQTFLGPVSDLPAQACPRCPSFPRQVETVLPLLLLVSLQGWDVLLGSPFREFFCGSCRTLGSPYLLMWEKRCRKPWGSGQRPQTPVRGSRAKGQGAACVEAAVWVGVTGLRSGKGQGLRDPSNEQMPLSSCKLLASRQEEPGGSPSGDTTQEGLQMGMIA